MNTSDYIKEAERQLTVDKDPTQKFKEVDEQLDQMVENGDITNKVKKILQTNKPKTPNIYFLPKVHKQTLPPPGRPIVSANSCLTEKISAFVDHFLNPLVKESKSYIKDTTDFINKIERIDIKGKSVILGTLDVTSLYTNIPNEEGINCIKEILKTERNTLEKPSNNSLIELLEMVLTKNNFQFNGDQFLQIGGTAMGTRVAPTYANLFMRKLETEILNKSELKPMVWYRYIDDIFFIWDHGEDEVYNWITYLNKYHKTIKFTAETSKEEISFLDTKVRINKDQKLYTDLFVKPTDTNSYLKYDSAHPPNCKKSIPYSQFLRIKRICQNEQYFLTHAETKKQEFKTKGYPEKELERALNEVKNKDRNDLLNPKNKNEIETDTKGKLFLTTTYREGYQYIPKIVRNNWDILVRASTTKKLHRADLMISYRKPRDLRSYLVKAKTDYKGTEIKADKGICAKHENKCDKKDCKYCTLLDTNGKIENDKRQFNTKRNITCNSSNLIYCIECTKCNKKYVGQTKRKIKERLREHIYGIKKQKETDVSYHFNTNGHHGIHDMKVYILDFIHAHPESKRAKSLRNTIEYNYIHRIGTSAPQGMNILDNRYG